MFDRQTGSYWHQVSGVGIVGPNCEQTLKLLPSLITTWGEWKTLHSDTLILSRNTGYQRNYSRDPFAGYGARLSDGRFPFPVNEAARDGRLLPGTEVIGVEIGDSRRAYAPDVIGNAAINDSLGDQPFVVFSKDNPDVAAAYFSAIDGEMLTFRFEDDRFIDNETHSTWNMAGTSIDGDLAGTQLESVPSRVTFWFALVATYPDIKVYAPAE